MLPNQLQGMIIFINKFFKFKITFNSLFDEFSFKKIKHERKIISLFFAYGFVLYNQDKIGTTYEKSSVKSHKIMK